MADNIYTDLVKRAAAIVQEAIPGADVRHYALFQGSTFPYVLTRLAQSDQDSNSDEIKTEDRTVQIRVVIGHLQGDYDGELDDDLGAYIDAVYDAFDLTTQLTSTSYPTAPDYLDAEGARIESDTGLALFQGYLGQTY